MAATGANFLTPGDTPKYLNEEVRAAYWDEGISVPALTTFDTDEEGDGDGSEEPEPKPPPPPMPANDVSTMLSEKANWKLVVQKDDAVYVLTKEALRKKWNSATITVPVDVAVRPISPSEKLLHDAVPKLYAPDVSYERLKEALALPVAQAGLIGTAAGLFGLLALRDKMTHPDAMELAVAFAGLAVGVSLVGRYFLREVTVKPARLDLLEKRHKEMIRGPLLRARVGLVLLIVAVAAACYSTFPDAEPDDAKATISTPTIDQVQDARTVTVAFAWSKLADEVASVRTTVDRDGARLKTRVSPKQDEGVEDEIEVKLGEAATIVVATIALDESGSELGSPTTKSFAVP